MRRHRIEGARVARPECMPNLVDLVGLPVERTGDHEERVGSAQAVGLLDDRHRGRAAEHDLLHGAENDTPSVHAVLPGRFLGSSLWSSWEDRLAE